MPFLSNPFTDFTHYLIPNYLQWPNGSMCGKLELKLMDCIEAYGANAAREKCSDLLYDMFECRTNITQTERVKAIRAERMKQYRAGKIPQPFDEHPPLDSLLYL